jgi:hypothetical protein
MSPRAGPERLAEEENTLLPPGFEPRTLQPVVPISTTPSSYETRVLERRFHSCADSDTVTVLLKFTDYSPPHECRALHISTMLFIPVKIILTLELNTPLHPNAINLQVILRTRILLFRRTVKVTNATSFKSIILLFNTSECNTKLKRTDN